MKRIFFLFGFFICLLAVAQDAPEGFVTHKVKKKETLYGLARQYNISIDQIKEFNPLIEKIGLKKKMILQIPVYPVVAPVQAVPLADGLSKYLVQPKETKWRLAYRYGVTVQELEKLNPQIIEGLKIGQEIVVPKRTAEETQALEAEFNYYKVKPKEGFYRLEKKLGVTQAELVALNPGLPTTGLQAGMILKIPPNKTGDLKIDNDLLVEKARLEDSLFSITNLNLVVFLPFKTNAIEFDSLEKTEKILQKRNIHTIALDMYMGMEMAIAKADSLGIRTALTVFDTQNNKTEIRKIVSSYNWKETDGIIGPLIPSNFDVASQMAALQKTPMIAPLSSKPVKKRKQVYQSVTSTKRMRNKMLTYLKQIIDTTQNVMIIADTLNASFAKTLKKEYPFAQRVIPENGGFVVPDLIDSLLTDSLPNKVIFESQNLGLAANVTSLLNAQISNERSVQLFTTQRTAIYDNPNISQKHLGNLGFTYVSGSYPQDNETRKEFKDNFQKRFGDYPTKESIRAYDVTLDIILRLATANTIEDTTLGETDYLENRFYYLNDPQGGFQNTASFILQHQGYDIFEIKK